MVKRIMKHLRAALLLLGFFALASYPAYACLCLPLKPRKELKEAKSVFIGKVVGLKLDEENFGEVSVKFEVERYWKNVPGPYVWVVTNRPGPGSCGLHVVEGESYLIFAYGDKRLETSLCSARAVERATEW